jgi:hypothetical protein
MRDSNQMVLSSGDAMSRSRQQKSAQSFTSDVVLPYPVHDSFWSNQLYPLARQYGIWGVHGSVAAQGAIRRQFLVPPPCHRELIALRQL